MERPQAHTAEKEEEMEPHIAASFKRYAGEQMYGRGDLTDIWEQIYALWQHIEDGQQEARPPEPRANKGSESDEREV